MVFCQNKKPAQNDLPGLCCSPSSLPHSHPRIHMEPNAAICMHKLVIRLVTDVHFINEECWAAKGSKGSRMTHKLSGGSWRTIALRGHSRMEAMAGHNFASQEDSSLSNLKNKQESTSKCATQKKTHKMQIVCQFLWMSGECTHLCWKAKVHPPPLGNYATYNMVDISNKNLDGLFEKSLPSGST